MISSLYCTVSVSQCLWVALDDIIICYDLVALTLRYFNFFFQQFLWFLQLLSYLIKWYQKEQGINLRIYNSGWHETSSTVVKCYSICHLTWLKTKNVNKLLRKYIYRNKAKNSRSHMPLCIMKCNGGWKI